MKLLVSNDILQLLKCRLSYVHGLAKQHCRLIIHPPHPVLVPFVPIQFLSYTNAPRGSENFRPIFCHSCGLTGFFSLSDEPCLRMACLVPYSLSHNSGYILHPYHSFSFPQLIPITQSSSSGVRSFVPYPYSYSHNTPHPSSSIRLPIPIQARPSPVHGQDERDLSVSCGFRRHGDDFCEGFGAGFVVADAALVFSHPLLVPADFLFYESVLTSKFLFGK
jgi:hypothetical protein